MKLYKILIFFITPILFFLCYQSGMSQSFLLQKTTSNNCLKTTSNTPLWLTKLVDSSFVNNEIKLINVTYYSYYPDSSVHQLLFKVPRDKHLADDRILTLYYDDQKHMINNILEVWDGFNRNNSTQNIYTYNSSGKLERLVIQKWGALTAGWINDTRANHIYNITNEDSLIIYQDWFNNYWVNDRKVKFIYEYNKLMYNLFQYWNKDQATWIDEQRVTFNYDTNGNVISNLVENHVGSEWIYSAKTIISYNNHQDPVTNIQQSWDTTNSSWNNVQKTTFTYNSNFKRSKVCFQLWKNGKWETDINQTYIYSETRPETVPLLIEETSSAIAESFQLNQNYPNPFNPTTQITYQLKSAQNVKITVYDITGRRVAVLIDQKQSAGQHSVTFHGDGLSSGVYIYRLKAGDFTKTRKMILLK